MPSVLLAPSPPEALRFALRVRLVRSPLWPVALGLDRARPAVRAGFLRRVVLFHAIPVLSGFLRLDRGPHRRSTALGASLVATRWRTTHLFPASFARRAPSVFLLALSMRPAARCVPRARTCPRSVAALSTIACCALLAPTEDPMVQRLCPCARRALRERLALWRVFGPLVAVYPVLLEHGAVSLVFLPRHSALSARLARIVTRLACPPAMAAWRAQPGRIPLFLVPRRSCLACHAPQDSTRTAPRAPGAPRARLALLRATLVRRCCRSALLVLLATTQVPKGLLNAARAQWERLETRPGRHPLCSAFRATLGRTTLLSGGIPARRVLPEPRRMSPEPLMCHLASPVRRGRTRVGAARLRCAWSVRRGRTVRSPGRRARTRARCARRGRGAM